MIISRQNRKMRDSSNESDEELEPRTISPLAKIDGTKNVLPSKIKAAAVSLMSVKITRNKQQN